MPINTTVAPRQLWKFVACAALCFAFALWGAYDYWVSIPRRERDAASFQKLQETFNDFERRNAARPLPQSELDQWAKVRDQLDAFGGRIPEPPPKWDRPVQLWLYVVGCGVIGFPWCLWALWSLRKRNMRLEEDGTLMHSEGRWAADEVDDIDMNRWMEKSIAVLRHRDGRTLVLDDYKHRNMHLIVGHYAHRFQPELWQPDARQIKTSEEDRSTASVAETT